MSIFLGNLSVEQLEKRTGIILTDEHREYMKEHIQEEVNNTLLEVGSWHCFDIPFMLMTSDKAEAEVVRLMEEVSRLRNLKGGNE